MPLNIEKAKEETRTVVVSYGGEEAAVTFYPRRVTKSFYRELRNAETDGIDQLINSLAILIESWEVVDNEGNQLAATPEVMADFPLDFLSQVSEAIADEATPSQKKGKR